jgi:hypothetical protein
MRYLPGLSALLAAGSLVVSTEGEAQTRRVLVNSVRLPDAEVQGLERQYRISLADGDYWYDKSSGAWGKRGGPTVGFTLPGLQVGGPLRADASAGNTGVFINGRQLHQNDVMALMQLGPVYQGRYWMDGQGYFGVEGGPALGNLWLLARAAGRGAGGAQTSYTRSGAMFGSDGNGCLVFNDPSSGTSYTGSGC